MKLSRRNFIQALVGGVVALFTREESKVSPDDISDAPDWVDTSEWYLKEDAVCYQPPESFDSDLWDTILNDDLDALRAVPMRVAQEARAREPTLIWAPPGMEDVARRIIKDSQRPIEGNECQPQNSNTLIA